MVVPRHPKVPPVGVYAKTEVIARSLIREMNIRNGVGIGKNSGFRGLMLSTLLVDDSAWPLTPQERHELLPALSHTKGYILHIARHDPKPRTSR